MRKACSARLTVIETERSIRHSGLIADIRQEMLLGLVV